MGLTLHSAQKFAFIGELAAAAFSVGNIDRVLTDIGSPFFAFLGSKHRPLAAVKPSQRDLFASQDYEKRGIIWPQMGNQ